MNGGEENTEQEKNKTSNSKQVTLKDIAAAAGVSPMTVSFALRGTGRMTAETRRRILSITEEMNYIPNLSAKRLRAGANKILGIIVTDIVNPFHARMVRLADSLAHQHGYGVSIADSNWDATREIKAVEYMLQIRVAGLIVFLSETTEKSYDMLVRSGIPHVAVDTRPDFYHGAFSVFDFAFTGYISCDHLLERGCRRLTFLTGERATENFSAFRLIKQGMRARLDHEPAGSCSLEVVNAGLTIGAGVAAFESLHASGRTPEGVLCVNDLVAIGVIEAARQSGLHAGQDLAVMGIDNLDISSLESVSLTSVADPRDESVRLAVTALIDGIEMGKAVELASVLKPRLIARSSTEFRRRSNP